MKPFETFLSVPQLNKCPRITLKHNLKKYFSRFFCKILIFSIHFGLDLEGSDSGFGWIWRLKIVKMIYLGAQMELGDPPQHSEIIKNHYGQVEHDSEPPE